MLRFCGVRGLEPREGDALVWYMMRFAGTPNIIV